MPHKPPVHIMIWVPDYESSTGGIQTFSRFFVKAVLENYPSADVQILSKNDDSVPNFPDRPGKTLFRCTGWWPASTRTLMFAFQALWVTLRFRPQVLISTHVNFGPLAWLARMFTGAKYALVAHGIDVWSPAAKKHGIHEIPDVIRHPHPTAMGIRRADRVWAVSRFTRNRLLQEFGLSPDRVDVLPNTFDPQQFRPGPKPPYLLRRYGLTPDQPVILTVARLAGAERYKGYDQILRALPHVRSQVPNVRFVLAGRGGDRARVLELAKKLGVDDALTLAGFVPDHELNDHYNLCDVFAMPSKGEGFGIVFLEAMACGKPVLAGNRDGSTDAVLSGEIGQLVDPDNVAEIQDSLTVLLQRSSSRPIFRDPSLLRSRVIDAFSYERFRSVVGELLRDLDGGIRSDELSTQTIPSATAQRT